MSGEPRVPGRGGVVFPSLSGWGGSGELGAVDAGYPVSGLGGRVGGGGIGGGAGVGDVVGLGGVGLVAGANPGVGKG